jgi:hypothetical protein
MIMSMQEREQKCDARYQYIKLWRASICTKIIKTMKGVAHGQERRE